MTTNEFIEKLKDACGDDLEREMVFYDTRDELLDTEVVSIEAWKQGVNIMFY